MTFFELFNESLPELEIEQEEAPEERDMRLMDRELQKVRVPANKLGHLSYQRFYIKKPDLRALALKREKKAQ